MGSIQNRDQLKVGISDKHLHSQVFSTHLSTNAIVCVTSPLVN